MNRSIIRSILKIEILSALTREGLSIEDAEKRLMEMDKRGEIGMRTDLVFNELQSRHPERFRDEQPKN